MRLPTDIVLQTAILTTALYFANAWPIDGDTAMTAVATAWTLGARSTNASTADGPNPIKTGYVAFGDSFAAGIGTGTTDGSACRQGEFSYPKLLAATVQNIDFQNLACSGAKIGDISSGGADSQIDQWKNPANADIATISIGGNDIGFSNIVNACVLWYDGPNFSGKCDTEIKAATSILTGNDLYRDIFQAFQQILQKSGRSDFKLYVTGYPAFFNVDTTYCNDVTFYYWLPHYRLLPTETVAPFLDTGLRLQLNNLVQDLNTFLSGLVNDVNSQHTNSPVVFVPTDAAFNNHRFCEEGVNEPDSARTDTWFFLSGWGDNSLDGVTTAYIGDDAIPSGNTTALPDPSTCDPNAADVFDAMTCMTAQAANVAGSFEQATIQNDSALIAEGELSAVRMPWWLATRQAKTFHPKTLGHLAYKNAIMGVW